MVNRQTFFKADALGALTDPTKFTSKQAIQQKNLVPRQQAYQKRPVSPPPVINPVITAAPVLGESDQYKAVRKTRFFYIISYFGFNFQV
jgi:hypothetical protein